MRLWNPDRPEFRDCEIREGGKAAGKMQDVLLDKFFEAPRHKASVARKTVVGPKPKPGHPAAQACELYSALSRCRSTYSKVQSKTKCGCRWHC